MESFIKGIRFEIELVMQEVSEIKKEMAEMKEMNKSFVSDEVAKMNGEINSMRRGDSCGGSSAASTGEVLWSGTTTRPFPFGPEMEIHGQQRILSSKDGQGIQGENVGSHLKKQSGDLGNTSHAEPVVCDQCRERASKSQRRPSGESPGNVYKAMEEARADQGRLQAKRRRPFRSQCTPSAMRGGLTWRQHESWREKVMPTMVGRSWRACVAQIMQILTTLFVTRCSRIDQVSKSNVLSQDILLDRGSWCLRT